MKDRLIILIGNLYNIHIFRLTKQLKECGWKIWGIPLRDLEIYKNYSKFLRDFEVLDVYDRISEPILYHSNIKMVRRIVNIFKAIKGIPKNFFNEASEEYHYVVVNIHYVHPYIAFLILRSNIVDGFPVVSSFWGSDILYNFPKIYQKIQIELLKKSELITVINERMRKKLLSIFPEINSDKIVVVKFGSLDLDLIDSINNEQIENFKASIGIPSKSLICTISYTGHPIHNHLKILEVIGNIEEEFMKRKKIYFVLPLTYGDSDYINSIRNYVRKFIYSDRILILEKPLTNLEVAILRKMTDVFIHTPEYDTLSASMLEHIYAGSISLIGGWLPYDELYESDAFFVKIDSINHLRKALIDVIDNLENYRQQAFLNKKIIRNILNTFTDWNVVFEKALEFWKSRNNINL